MTRWLPVLALGLCVLAVDAGAAETRPEPVIYAAPDCTSDSGGAGSDYAAQFAAAVQRCWVLDPADRAARVSLTLGFALTPDGRVKPDSLTLRHASGGDPGAIRRAFGAARRAVLRCQGSSGYPLPRERYAEWRRVELCFSPAKPAK
ncbi:hypothetical protein [Pseudoponticoccus marisrubri]|uniref:TonB C-terminal domain-containing protein n=1 Tax=Pseudoponticoccus marisrubri TaxID=1685382 RepID=A0A0W7WH13_9RHOB|nr:hypothetical protein [Pseudoponticoccus marisrubri]KUF09823.1 hypothetical protein AVJ23_15350 [Pseudoponticoccus marisrubri]